MRNPPRKNLEQITIPGMQMCGSERQEGWKFYVIDGLDKDNFKPDDEIFHQMSECDESILFLKQLSSYEKEKLKTEIYRTRSIIKVLSFHIIRDCEMVKTFRGDQLHQVSSFLILDSLGYPVPSYYHSYLP